MPVDAVTVVVAAWSYVSALAKSFACNSPFGSGCIPDRRAFSLHTDSDRGFRSKDSVCRLLRAASGVSGQPVPGVRCAASSHTSECYSAPGPANPNCDDLLSPLLDLRLTRVPAGSD